MSVAVGVAVGVLLGVLVEVGEGDAGAEAVGV